MNAMTSRFCVSAMGIVLAVGLGMQPAFAKNCQDDSQCPDNEVCRTAKSAAKAGARVCTQVVEGGGIGTRQAATGSSGVGEQCGQATKPVSCHAGLVCIKSPATAEVGACQQPGSK